MFARVRWANTLELQARRTETGMTTKARWVSANAYFDGVPRQFTQVSTRGTRSAAGRGPQGMFEAHSDMKPVQDDSRGRQHRALQSPQTGITIRQDGGGRPAPHTRPETKAKAKPSEEPPFVETWARTTSTWVAIISRLPSSSVRPRVSGTAKSSRSMHATSLSDTLPDSSSAISFTRHTSFAMVPPPSCAAQLYRTTAGPHDFSCSRFAAS